MLRLSFQSPFEFFTFIFPNASEIKKSAELLHEQSSMEKMHAQLHFLI